MYNTQNINLRADQGTINKQLITAVDTLLALIDAIDTGGGGGGASTWGSITGTLSSQTDLQAALDTKVTTANLNESIDDRVGAFLVAGTNITLNYNDAANSLTISAASSSGNAYYPQGW